MTKSEFKKNFEDAQPPKMLMELFEAQDKWNNFFSGGFEFIDSGPRTAAALFRGDREAVKQFVLFAEEADGSVFGFWLYDGRTLENAPIVRLDADGGGTVLANSLQDFFALLAVGCNDLGASYLEEGDPPSEYLPQYRQWLKKKYGIVAPEDPQALIDQAEEAHPSLSRNSKRDGSGSVSAPGLRTI